MDEIKEYIGWAHRGNPIPFGKLPSAHNFRILNGREKRLVILLPSLNKKNCTGGPNTILRFAGEVAAQGINVICFSLQAPAFLQSDFQNHLINNLGISENVAPRILAVSPLTSPPSLWLNRGDRIMATASWTFPLAKVLAQRCGKAAPAYFIQDIEPLFLGLGLGHAWLMETYYERFLPIINSSSLAQALFDIGLHSFADQQFRKDALVFTPAVDRTLFHPASENTDRKILFLYTRLNEQESRNMPELALEAVNRMCWEKLVDPNEWEIHCYGAPDAPPFRMNNGMLTKMLPSLDMRGYAMELRKASLGICFVFSPHPGYMAFELASSGVPVITNTCLTKTASLLHSFSPLIHAVRPTYDAVTACLRRILQEKKYRSCAGQFQPVLKLPESWTESFAPLIPRFMEWYN